MESVTCPFIVESSTTGPGTTRFEKLEAVQAGNRAAPVDLRYLKKAKFHAEKHEDLLAGILSFLEQIYCSVAENLPDVRDSGHDDGADPYALHAEQSAIQMDESRSSSAQSKFKAVVKSKVKKKQRGVQVHPQRTVAAGCEERWLPPGHMKDYWVQYRGQVPQGETVASFPTFWRVWAAHYSFMKFRTTSSHAQCTECVKHKQMISGLSGHLRARHMQVELLHQHLNDQFQDRLAYWRRRGRSRQRGQECCVILDGMDQGKFALPRHAFLKAKAFDGWSRPRLHVAGALMHGHGLFMFVSNPDVPKDSNTACEQILYCLNHLKRSGHDCSKLTIQSDNTCRECKNGFVMRLCAALVSCGVVQEIIMANLRSGHSHDDIDQVFGWTADWVRRKLPRAETTDDVVCSLQSFLDQVDRPYEPVRRCVKLDQARDW